VFWLHENYAYGGAVCSKYRRAKVVVCSRKSYNDLEAKNRQELHVSMRVKGAFLSPFPYFSSSSKQQRRCLGCSKRQTPVPLPSTPDFGTLSLFPYSVVMNAPKIFPYFPRSCCPSCILMTPILADRSNILQCP